MFCAAVFLFGVEWSERVRNGRVRESIGVFGSGGIWMLTSRLVLDKGGISQSWIIQADCGFGQSEKQGKHLYTFGHGTTGVKNRGSKRWEHMLTIVLTIVCQLPQGNRQHQPDTTPRPRRDTRPEELAQGEVLAGSGVGCRGCACCQG